MRRLAFPSRAGLAYDFLREGSERIEAPTRPLAGWPMTGTTPRAARPKATMTRRTRGREIALQVLYQAEQNPGLAPEEIRRFVERRLLGDRKLCEFTEGLIAGVQEHQPRIDALISEVAENWRLDRMAAIDRNILRLGAYEMLFCPDVPTKVAINEALELAKRYSTAQSSRFVNGILDRLLAAEAAGHGRPRAGAEAEPEAEAGRPRPSGADAGRRGAAPPPIRAGLTAECRRLANRPAAAPPARARRRGRPARPHHALRRRLLAVRGGDRGAAASACRRWRSPTTTRSRRSPSPGPRRRGWASS